MYFGKESQNKKRLERCNVNIYKAKTKKNRTPITFWGPRISQV